MPPSFLRLWSGSLGPSDDLGFGSEIRGSRWSKRAFGPGIQDFGTFGCRDPQSDSLRAINLGSSGILTMPQSWKREPSGSCSLGKLGRRHLGSFGVHWCRQSFRASARRVLRNEIAGGASRAKRPRASSGSSQSSVNGPSCFAGLDRCIGKLGALPRLRSFRQGRCRHFGGWCRLIGLERSFGVSAGTCRGNGLRVVHVASPGTFGLRRGRWFPEGSGSSEPAPRPVRCRRRRFWVRPNLSRRL